MAIVRTLVIEASTYAGSVALTDGAMLLAERSVAMRGRDSEALMPAVVDVLGDAQTTTAELSQIVCGAGPGSFTSLRIAGGIAKGLALAANVPLVPVSSLALLVASTGSLSAGRYLGAIDALRGEHYVGLFEVSEQGEVSADGDSSRTLTPQLEALAERLHATLVIAGSVAGSVVPHARAATRLISLVERTPAADLASWEPAYGRLAEAQVKWEAAHGRRLAEA
jgi:tRNA threonylcarbamoyladenosine biosynthesis protein TsaB